MTGEHLNIEKKIASNRFSLIKSLLNSTWNYKTTILLIILAVIINAALLLSIPVGTINNEFYYSITQTQNGFIDTSLIPSIPNNPSLFELPRFQFNLTYTMNYHINYWVMIIFNVLAACGFLIESSEEMKNVQKLYYSSNFCVFLLGIIKAAYLLAFRGNFAPVNVLDQTIFLTFLPFALMIPVHLLLHISNDLNKFSISKIRKKGNILNFGILVIYTAAVSLSYLGMAVLIA
ncbi:MAG: hypothetical protein ACTSPM_04160 [Candidatus Heimdallarchaeota archaeon]